ncbi:glycosyltransferase family 2 protein [Flavobacterium sandaracinum]|uniref:Glycosyltransferase family 2 protein n=1 Tax=Flavobacterium sandaracinum TaxID=2541733 RepID=A0A4R5CNQ1_9FLAO|nr:glycosyltransferase family A protein [Flavobacterium sandaracinum]TDE02052.1 glycosyltransferase family 2 protein [Flavobacterium sandaracinum]
MLAIVVPYYKLTFFEETLKSLAIQTDKRFKVYIGDDASPENPNDLLEKYNGKFEFDYHRFKDNLGGISLVQQWERCVSLSIDEEWLMILGDDDYLDSNVVASFYNNFNDFNSKSNLVRYTSKLIYENLNTVSDLYKHPIWETATDSFYRKFSKESRSSLSEHIFSKQSYLKYGFHNYPLAWNSDDRAWIDFSDKRPIYTINESIVYVRVSSFSITGKRDNLLKKNASEIEFYKFLISRKFKYYRDYQRIEIIKKYGKEIRRYRSLLIYEWLFISYYCVRYFDFDYLKKGFSMTINKLKS